MTTLLTVWAIWAQMCLIHLSRPLFLRPSQHELSISCIADRPQ